MKKAKTVQRLCLPFGSCRGSRVFSSSFLMYNITKMKNRVKNRGSSHGRRANLRLRAPTSKVCNCGGGVVKGRAQSLQIAVFRANPKRHPKDNCIFRYVIVYENCCIWLIKKKNGLRLVFGLILLIIEINKYVSNVIIHQHESHFVAISEPTLSGWEARYSYLAGQAPSGHERPNSLSLQRMYLRMPPRLDGLGLDMNLISESENPNTNLKIISIFFTIVASNPNSHNLYHIQIRLD